MLLIREQQMAVLEQDIRRRIKLAAVDKLRAAPPQPGVVLPDDAALQALLDRAELRIDRYRGNFHFDAHRYVLLMLEFGDGFDAEPWAVQILEDPEIPGPSKLDVLDIHAVDRRGLRSGPSGRPGN